MMSESIRAVLPERPALAGVRWKVEALESRCAAAWHVTTHKDWLAAWDTAKHAASQPGFSDVRMFERDSGGSWSLFYEVRPEPFAAL